jgi:hypothetical protein
MGGYQILANKYVFGKASGAVGVPVPVTTKKNVSTLGSRVITNDDPAEKSLVFVFW